jgi:hypothetical protein
MSTANDLSNNKILDELVQGIKDTKKVKSDQKIKKLVTVDKNLCKAAVPINTIGNAYKKLLKGDKICLVKEKHNDSFKITAYCGCSKTTIDNNNYCHLHERTMKVNNNELKNFEKDILPKDKNDKLRWIPTIDDSYFENMGKRGTKKKNIENTYVFSNKSDPVLLVLIHKDAKLATQLSICATQLLKFNSYVLPKNIELLDETKERAFIDKNISGNHIDNFVNMLENIESIKSNKSALLKKSSSENSDTENSDAEDSDAENSDAENSDAKNSDSKKVQVSNVKSLVTENLSIKDLNAKDSDAEDSDAEDSDAANSDAANSDAADSDAEDSDAADSDAEDSDAEDSDAEDSDAEDSDAVDSDAEEQISCEEITTLKGETLFYDKNTNIVYRPDQDESGKDIGFLTEIIKKYSTIYFEENKKYYTVITDIKDSTGTEYKRCTITDKFFNKKLKFMGKLSLIENNKYEFIFNK